MSSQQECNSTKKRIDTWVDTVIEHAYLDIKYLNMQLGKQSQRRVFPSDNDLIYLRRSPSIAMASAKHLRSCLRGRSKLLRAAKPPGSQFLSW